MERYPRSAQFEIDDSKFPVVTPRCPSAFDLRSTDALQSGLERFARRQKFVPVCGIRPVSRVPDAMVRCSVREPGGAEALQLQCGG